MLNQITINLEELKSSKLNESYAAQFAAQIEYLLRYMSMPSGPDFSNIQGQLKVAVTGKKPDLERFSNTLASEKRYMDSYLKHGLGDPRVRNNKWKLEQAVFKFERDTGLKWPLR